MKNRDNVLHQLGKLDTLTNQLNFIIKHQEPIESYMKTIEQIREVTEQIRSFIENEQIVGYELNRAAR
jgi:hypothetical protein